MTAKRLVEGNVTTWEAMEQRGAAKVKKGSERRAWMVGVRHETVG